MHFKIVTRTIQPPPEVAVSQNVSTGCRVTFAVKKNELVKPCFIPRTWPLTSSQYWPEGALPSSLQLLAGKFLRPRPRKAFGKNRFEEERVVVNKGPGTLDSPSHLKQRAVAKFRHRVGVEAE